MSSPLPPGWYDDPDGSPNAERRWNGHAWTPERRRKTARPTPSPPHPQNPQAAPQHPQHSTSPQPKPQPQPPPRWQAAPPPPHPSPPPHTPISDSRQPIYGGVGPAALPIAMPGGRKSLWPFVLIGLSIVVIIGLVTFGARHWLNTTHRWSAFPYTTTCRAVSDPLSNPPPPQALRTSSIELTHAGDQKLGLTVNFTSLQALRGQTIISPYSGEEIFAPGSFLPMIVLPGTRSGDDSPIIWISLTPTGWVASRADFAIKQILDKDVPEHPSGNLLTEVQLDGASLNLVLDLDGQPSFFDGIYVPEPTVNLSLQGVATPDNQDGAFATMYQPQKCTRS